MPYVVRRTDGNVQLILQDGTIDSSTGLYLVGRSATSYGEYVADNFIRLLENFASTTEPSNPLSGQIWYDKANGFKYWNGAAWTAFSQTGATGPTGPKGYSGSHGATGPVGDTGPQGYRGYVGSQGPTGIQGQLGPTGDTGYTGSRGPTGYVGSASTVAGPIGYTGSRGATGPQGPTGYVGSHGASGAIGPDGPRGLTGYVGSKGDSGNNATGDLSFTGHTINGTTLNTSITINPLGTGGLVVNGKLTPAGNISAMLGDATHRWTDIYVGAVRFHDGSSIQSAYEVPGATPPTTSFGAIGDYTGKVAFDTNYFYYCLGNYNGAAPIWRRTPWDTAPW